MRVQTTKFADASHSHSAPAPAESHLHFTPRSQKEDIARRAVNAKNKLDEIREYKCLQRIIMTTGQEQVMVVYKYNAKLSASLECVLVNNFNELITCYLLLQKYRQNHISI